MKNKRHILGAFIALAFLVTESRAQDYEYDEVLEPSMKMGMESLRAHQMQAMNYVFYNMNVGTPGFLEPGLWNIRNKEGSVKARPFYRWIMGPLTQTRDHMTMALDANSRGFFVVQLPGALSYTRDGRIRLDTSNRLVTMQGSYPFVNVYGGGAIIVPQGADLSISRSGVVYADGDAVGKIKVDVFSNAGLNRLVVLNGSFFVSSNGEEPELMPPDDYKYSVLQGFIEESNVTKGIVGDVAMLKNASNGETKALKIIGRIISSAVQMAQP
ncbi:MAG: flagellar hook basal-body protein [Candidatus Margulisbacteria bacterium]|nr:flagellar hook basal-body protein [Candidatus Margulisiibacteriota bacterium]